METIKRNPVLVIGILAAAIIAGVQQAVGSGVLGADVADTVVKALSPDGGWLIPIILAIVTRFFVTPVAAPALPVGTEVTVITPAGQPNTSATL